MKSASAKNLSSWVHCLRLHFSGFCTHATGRRHVMPEREIVPELAEWQARRNASFHLRQQQPAPEPQQLLPPLPLHKAQALSHTHQSSLSSLPPSDPVTPHTNASTSTRGADRPGGGSSSASDAGDEDSGSRPPSSRFAAPYAASDSPRDAEPRHRLQPSWPQLSTSGLRHVEERGI